MELPFEDVVRETLADVKSYGMRKYGGLPNSDDKDGLQRFRRACHEGFYRAQDRILETLPCLEDEVAATRKRLKAARRGRDKEGIARVTTELSVAERQVQIIRKLADTLAWTMLSDQEWLARRFYMGNDQPAFRHSNIESVIPVVDHHRMEDPDGFALITDITSFLQVGDLLIISFAPDSPSLRVVEVKEGRVNEKILDFLSFLTQSQCALALERFVRNQTDEVNRQLIRTIDQSIRGHQVAEVVNTGRGTDPVTGQGIVIGESDSRQETWDSELLKLIEKSRERGWAIDTIDDCLLVGVYSDLRMQDGFGIWLASAGHGEIIPIDLRSGFKEPASRPLFMRPLGEANLLDITMGRLVVKVALNMRNYCKKLEAAGGSIEWVEQRDLQKKKMSTKWLLRLNHKYLRVEVDGASTYVGGGLVGRALFSGLRPDVTAEMLIQRTRDSVRELAEKLAPAELKRQ